MAITPNADEDGDTAVRKENGTALPEDSLAVPFKTKNGFR